MVLKQTQRPVPTDVPRQVKNDRKRKRNGCGKELNRISQPPSDWLLFPCSTANRPASYHSTRPTEGNEQQRQRPQELCRHLFNLQQEKRQRKKQNQKQTQQMRNRSSRKQSHHLQRLKESAQLSIGREMRLHKRQQSEHWNGNNDPDQQTKSSQPRIVACRASQHQRRNRKPTDGSKQTLQTQHEVSRQIQTRQKALCRFQ